VAVVLCTVYGVLCLSVSVCAELLAAAGCALRLSGVYLWYVGCAAGRRCRRYSWRCALVRCDAVCCENCLLISCRLMNRIY
jgi:hypothetical protein